MTEVRERLSVSKRKKQTVNMERPNHKELSEVKLKGKYRVKNSKHFADLENLYDNVELILHYL
jgi:hypothetical protein